MGCLSQQLTRTVVLHWCQRVSFAWVVLTQGQKGPSSPLKVWLSLSLLLSGGYRNAGDVFGWLCCFPAWRGRATSVFLEPLSMNRPMVCINVQIALCLSYMRRARDIRLVMSSNADSWLSDR